jgi:N-acetylmuramoyl-L-alanine amidase
MQALDGALKNRYLRTDNQTKVGKSNGGVLTGSIHARVPVLLIEMGVITNRQDGAFLASAAGQKKLAFAMTEGVLAIRKQHGRYPDPPPTRSLPNKKSTGE